MMQNKTNKNGVNIPEDMKWLFDAGKDAQQKREEFVNDFFGISKMEKDFGTKINELEKTIGRI